jgi:hypothetical protein
VRLSALVVFKIRRNLHRISRQLLPPGSRGNGLNVATDDGQGGSLATLKLGCAVRVRQEGTTERKNG